MVTGRKAFPLSRAELVGILSTYQGTTTSDGAVTKDSLIDSRLIGQKDEAIIGKLVQILSGTCISQQTAVTLFNTVTGEVSFAALSDQILAGTLWRLANIGAGGGGGFGTVAQDAIYFDPNNGDVLPINDGSATKPLSVEADVLIQLAAKKLSKVIIVESVGSGFSTFTLPADVVGISFWGVDREWTRLSLNGKNADGCTFHNLNLRDTNAAVGYSTCYNCGVMMTDVSSGWDFYDCDIFAYTLTPAVGQPLFYNCVFRDTIIQWNALASQITIDGIGTVNLLANTDTITISGTIQYGLIVGTVVVVDKTTAQYDAIYFDNISGTAGTDPGIGTPDRPVNNLADARTLMALHNLPLKLAGGRVFDDFVSLAHTHTAADSPIIMTDANIEPLKVNSLVGLTIYNVTDFSSGVITANTVNTVTVVALVGGGDNTWQAGDVYNIATAAGRSPWNINITTALDIQIIGDPAYDITVSATGSVTLLGDLVCKNLIVNNASLRFAIAGDCYVYQTITKTAGNVMISGNVFAGIDISNASHGLLIQGNCEAVNDISAAGGTIWIYGNTRVGNDMTANSGTISMSKDLHAASVYLLVGSNITVDGNATIFGIVDNNASNFTVRGNCQVSDDIDNAAAGVMLIDGSLDCGGDLDNTAATSLTINGDTHITGIITNTTGLLEIYGNTYVGGRINQVDATNVGNFYIYGSVFCDGLININGTIGCGIDGPSEAGVITITLGDLQFYSHLTVDGDISVDAGQSLGIQGNFEHLGANLTNIGTLVCGSLKSNGDVDNSAATSFTVNGDAHIKGDVTNTTGALNIFGNCFVAGDISTTTGNITIDGNLEATNLSSTGTGDYNVEGMVKVNTITNSALGDILFTGGLYCSGGFDNTGGHNIGIIGDVFIGGTLTLNTDSTFGIYGNLHVNAIAHGSTGTFDVRGDLIVNATLGNSTTGVFTVTGKIQTGSNLTNVGTLSCISLDCGGAVDNTGAVSLTVNGDCYVAGSFTNDTSATVIKGVLTVVGALTNGAGSITSQPSPFRTKSTTISLNQAAGSYDLFTDTINISMIESLVITMPDAAAGGAVTSISIQTDNSTPQVFIDAVTGLVANLTAEAQLAWQGQIKLAVGKKIQLTIGGGAHGGAYVCAVDVQYRGITSEGRLV